MKIDRNFMYRHTSTHDAHLGFEGKLRRMKEGEEE
jgi:hypothetical protein